ncbi:MAG: sodium/solute symporter, partial [Saprospiraceae bacterium]|nr:sodium/solute symporter [Saprospiraceae bacterium]
LFAIVVFFSINVGGIYAQYKWHEMPTIPDKEGFAGMYAGVSHGVLIVAGGANFPEKRPWQGGVKQWYDHIYLLQDHNNEWQICKNTLPATRAYGISVSYGDQVIIVGGSDQLRHYPDVFSLEFQDDDVVVNDQYPPLPIPLSNMCGALVGDILVVAGGNQGPDSLSEKRCFMLDLSKGAEDRQWIEGPEWPGLPRIQAVAASHDGKFYLFSGFNLFRKEGKIDRTLLTDAYRLIPDITDLSKSVWEEIPSLPWGVAAAPSPAFTLGMDHIVIAGGLDAQTLTHTDPANHPGFTRNVYAFNVNSEQWVKMPEMPEGASRVTAPTTFWNGHWLVVNGEKGPGVRSPHIYSLDTELKFGLVNWVTLIVYLLCMILIGLYFSRRESTTEDYFLAGGRIPWWAAGISIYGTQLSAITFMAVPAIVYATDWRLAVGTFLILGIVPLIITYYLPYFRKLNITTAYEFLEERFNLRVRLLGSLIFILLQLGRMGIVLYLPSIAISSVTGIDIIWCIAVMGIFATIYTVLGGIEAVIWTDVVQVVILMGGALASIFIAISDIQGGLPEVIRIGQEYHKFKIMDFGWDYTQLVFWVAIIGFFFLNLISYTSDQVVIQRYLTVKSEKDAARSLWTNGIITLPGIIIFFGLGTTLFVFYLMNPEIVTSNKPDEILPYFVVTQLPTGVAGLVISGVFAASMSSLDSSMNSISTAYVNDFHKRLNPLVNDRSLLQVARWVTILMGAFGTLTAIWIAMADVKFIFDFFQQLLGMIGGSLAGVFALAVFTKKANATGAIIGTFAGAITTFFVKTFTDVNGYLYGAVGVITCFLVGILVSNLTGQNKKSF